MSSEKKKPRHDHERSDWDLRYVVWGSIVLVVSVAIILAVSWWIFRKFDRWAADRQMGTARTTALENIPPEPRLQISPGDDWTEMLKREQAILNSYRWIDRSQRIVHIPIQRAMELLADRGLPVEGEPK
jgi:hypothetical protein